MPDLGHLEAVLGDTGAGLQATLSGTLDELGSAVRLEPTGRASGPTLSRWPLGSGGGQWRHLFMGKRLRHGHPRGHRDSPSRTSTFGLLPVRARQGESNARKTAEESHRVACSIGVRPIVSGRAVAGDLLHAAGGRRSGARCRAAGCRGRQALRRLRARAEPAYVLPRSGKPHRRSRLSVGARRMGGPAQPLVGRYVPGGPRRLHLAEALRARRQGRDPTPRAWPRDDHGARRGVRRGADARPDLHRLSPADQSPVHQYRRTTGWCRTPSRRTR